jgi:Family of unknown function (DUF5996)
MTNNIWPALPLEEWKETYETLHMWTRIVGKIRLKLTPLINHWWNVTLHVTARGLATPVMNYNDQLLQMSFDFVDHRLLIERDDGRSKSFSLRSRSVADFYREVMAALGSLDMPVTIWSTPSEVPNPIPFEQDHNHATYDQEYAKRLWRILAQANRVLTEFRSRFIGKASPVQFFWGGFDLAVTRFSGRTAPPHPGTPYGARFVDVEAYSHEVSSCGFWPGGSPVNEPVFYAYAYPEPQGFKDYLIKPPEAFYHADMGEFLLPYDVVRTAKSPDDVLLSFLQSTYEAASICGKWDRSALERQNAVDAINNI